MEIGFVSFNQEALNRANKVMKLLQGQGAIDELGLGRLRDAFSNIMFPGMSVLQTHAKYFVLMPALYAHLEKARISDTREARMLVRESEIKLTHRLMDGSPAGTVGIIGAEMLRRGEGYVKYDPTYVYLAGLETFGLIPRGVNIYALLAERSRQYQNLPKKQTGSAETGDDSEDLTGNRQLYKTCGEDYKFNSSEPLKIALSPAEAIFLKNQIITHTSKSLLAFLLDSGLYKNVTAYYFNELGKVFEDKLPSALYNTYRLALSFSRFAYLLRLRYAMLYDIAVGADEAAAGMMNKFNATLHDFKDEFTPEKIEEIIDLVTERVQEESCKVFILKAARLINESNFPELDRQIALREQAIKGLKRSKLINAKSMQQGKPFETPAMMSYRWNTIVRTVLTEIREGFDNE